MSPEKIILFDGICNLCNGLVKFIIRHDNKGEIRFAQLQSSFGEEFMKGHGLDPGDRNSVIYISGEQYFLRSAAILRILKDMGGGWRLLNGFIIVPRFIRDAVYDLVAKYRYRIFGKKESCMVPTPEIRERFLE
ncbi:MAG TPA: thiol-disulfide oxidoreductase DCC family protein [Bacteroidales bacterium]|jgi:predicted DCC family thiol-disulfide oxidoreductase YuxK|nr:thiol-disulfide oxidoreductase DCC family protein [Bacteroidales bacterium]